MIQRKLLVIGAAGGTGRLIVTQALEAGYEVTAFVRTPAAMPGRHDRLTLVAGSLPDGESALADALRGQDAVISALGAGQSLKSNGLIARCVPAILSAMGLAGVRRLIFTSAIGVGDAIGDAPLFSRVMAQLLLKDIYADKAAGEELIRRSGLEWTIVQPAQLTNGPLTGMYRAGERLRLSGIPKISRADTAHFLLGQLEDPASIGKVITIGY